MRHTSSTALADAIERAAREAPPEPDDGPDALGDEAKLPLPTLRRELEHAITARRKATRAKNATAEERWSKRVQALADLVNRLEPPPPRAPDEVLAEIQRYAGTCITLIEESLPDPIKPAEVWAA